MVSIYNVSPERLIEETAKELKKMPEMAPPEWAAYVKTGVHNMRPPKDEDWWYVRSAAIMRSVYKLGPIGVSKLRTKYGGRKNRGHKPDKTFRAGGNIIRKILQKLEIVGFLKQTEVGVHKGRILTPQGESFIDKIVVKLMKEEKKSAKQAVPEKKAEPKAEKAPVKEDKPKEEKPKKEDKAPESEKEPEKKAEAKKSPAKEEKPKAVEKKEKPKKETKPKAEPAAGDEE